MPNLSLSQGGFSSLVNLVRVSVASFLHSLAVAMMSRETPWNAAKGCERLGRRLDLDD